MNCQIFNNNDIFKISIKSKLVYFELVYFHVFNLIIITESKFILILIIKNVLNINNKELI